MRVRHNCFDCTVDRFAFANTIYRTRNVIAKASCFDMVFVSNCKRCVLVMFATFTDRGTI
jgi:hypothetical protein